MVPRILFAPLRVAAELISEPVKGLLILQDRHQFLSRLNRIVTSYDGKRGLRPEIRYVSRIEPQMGITYFDHKLLGPGSGVFLTLGAVLPALIFAEATVRPHLPRRIKADFDASYLKRDDFLFGGIRLTSPGAFKANQAPLARYSDKIWRIAVSSDIRLIPALHLNVGESWNLHDYGNGRFATDERPIVDVYCTAALGPHCLHPNVDPAQVPGYYSGADFFASDAQLVFDPRIDTHDTKLWYRFELGGRYAQSPSRDGARWIRGKGAAEIGFPLGSRTRVLDIRLAVELMGSLGGAPIPFTELVTLGGPNDMRGAATGRYRDFSSVLATIAYRWEVWMWMDAEIFNDWGGVFGKNLSGFRPDRLVPDIGGGIRIRSASRFLIRAQVAYGFSDGWQLMFATATPL